MLGASRDETYNGYSNWDTWNANLWLNNDSETYRAMRFVTDDSDLFESRGRMYLETGQPDWTDDWGNIRVRYVDDIDPSEVDWEEIRSSFCEE